MSDTYKGDILIVDDTPENLRFLSKTLSEQHYKVRSVTDGTMALTVAQSAPLDLILLDIKMPEMNGYEVCERLKAMEVTQDIPVIFLSALDDQLDKVKAFQVGGIDYITKPFQLEEVLARIQTHIALKMATQQILALNTDLEQRVKQRTLQLEKEIAERQIAQEKLLHMALHDALTELPNRTLFMKRLAQVLDHAKKNQDYTFSVMLLDCDHFKVVNDSLGHLVGDQLLIAVARRIEGCLGPSSMLARLGGDEFTILLEEDTKTGQKAIQVAKRIQSELTYPFQLGCQENFTNVSVGVVLGDRNYEKPEHLLRDADAAMYQAKAQGKACFKIFDSAMHHHAVTRLQMETDLRRAIERKEFQVYYQPIIDLQTEKVVGCEALVRWPHPTLNLLNPNVFLPTAEEAGLIDKIDILVLQKACSQIKQWQTQNVISEVFFVSTNLSAQNFLHPDLVQTIENILCVTGVKGHCLKLEITENTIMKNAQVANAILAQLKTQDIIISIDDFGTGYSSLSYLNNFPVDSLKIDRSFVTEINDLSTEYSNLKITQTIIALAEHLHLSTVAEGIETREQLKKLQQLGCNYGQGFYFSHPLTAEKMLQFLG
ncbi:EAL domain-containing protein [Spirulina sp. CS-785/01]|uniref:EAL domain-containing response regulator n=1 Tax=Spirulina sp. CS-785/01 TaxID=3021716 RepID=UPI00232DD0DA|nr:EAL domain-containing response regulator [Spirulina sp. CS-785/01]MDB9315672.1 EAL domain-containing protein [Spirulina sp. CS-785/01]